VDQSSQTCKQFHSKGDDVKSAATLSYVGYGVGAAGLAVAAVWTYFNVTKPKDTQPATGVSVVPWADRNGGGGAMHFSF